jgi:hypothetical protein
LAVKTATFAMALSAVLAISAAGQEARCISSIKSIQFKNQPLPKEVKAQLPGRAFVRLVLPLSSMDILSIYELGERPGGVEVDPDTRLLITRQGRPVFRYALKNLPTSKGDDPDWGMAAVAMKAVHLCSGDADLTYLVLQAGNAGGFYVALKRSGEGYRLLPISDATQGRLVLSVNRPGSAEVWTAAESGACTACPKQFEIREYEFDGREFRLVSRQRAKRQYSSFQDDPLLVKP